MQKVRGIIGRFLQKVRGIMKITKGNYLVVEKFLTICFNLPYALIL